jgi:hypothetical protein
MDGVRSRSRKLKTRQKFRRFVIVPAILILAVIFNLAVAVDLATDESNDGKLYSQMAANIVERDVFSAAAEAPYDPTYIRLPGYPLFLAADYEIAGVGNNTAVRVTQAFFTVAACLLAGLIAWNWQPGSKRKRRKAAYATFVLAAFCPFTAIFAATILTETLTIFFLAAMTLAATYAIKSKKGNALAWWTVAGLIAGIAVTFRPDSGLFALGLGLTLIVVMFANLNRVSFKARLVETFLKGSVFSLAFIAVLTPWTIRNEQLFGVFEPLAPAHAEAPGEFVPRGYLMWVRTWIDDARYIDPVIWSVETKRITVDELPPYAFDSEDEKQKIAALYDQYNHSDPDEQTQQDEASNDEDDSADSNDDDSADSGSNDDNTDDENAELNLKISPEVDAGFQEIAEQRIARRPIHYYVELPAERAVSMWFDTHSGYYPFEGELFPAKELDPETYQSLLLPLFIALVWAYTLGTFAGSFFLLADRRRLSKLWVAMVVFLSLPRIIFFGTLENPEPRYLVELFLFASILSGIFISRFRFQWRDGYLSLGLLLRENR